MYRRMRHVNHNDKHHQNHHHHNQHHQHKDGHHHKRVHMTTLSIDTMLKMLHMSAAGDTVMHNATAVGDDEDDSENIDDEEEENSS